MVALGVIAALLAAVAVMLWATGGDPRVASQTWDAPFHINAIRYAATTGIVSPDSIGAFVAPYATYYPSGFTAVGVVVMGLTGVEPVVASNITATLLAGSLWPGAVMVAGALGVRWRPANAGLAGALAVTTWAMPWAPLGWGVLWPMAAGAAFGPIVLAATVAACAHARVAVWLPMAVGGLVGASGMHPRALVLIVLQCLVVLSWFLLNALVRTWSTPSPARRRLLLARSGALLALVVVPLALTVLVARGAKFTAIDWSTNETFLTALLHHLIGAPADAMTTGLAAAALLVGLVVSWRSPGLRWVAASWMVLVVVDAATAGLRLRWISAITRLWYDDRYRSVTMLGFIGVVLVVVGLRAVAGRLAATRWGSWVPRRTLTVALAVATIACALPSAAGYLHDRYAGAAELAGRSLVSDAKRAFYGQLATVVPPDDKVLNNAADGSALMYAYAGVRPVFYSIGSPASTAHGDELQRTLVTRTDHEQVCRELAVDGIRWVLTPTVSMDRLSVAAIPTPGIEIPDGFWLTTLALSDPTGQLRLYRITGCHG